MGTRSHTTRGQDPRRRSLSWLTPAAPSARRPLLGALLTAVLALGGCGGPEASGTLRWPSERPGTPDQPATELDGLRASVERIDYGPETTAIGLALINTSDEALSVDFGAACLAWEALEYTPLAAASFPGERTLEPGAEAHVELRYRLSRPLTSVGAELRLRALARPGGPLVEVPILALPPLPAALALEPK